MKTIQIRSSIYAGNTAWAFPMKDSELESRLEAIGLGCAGEIPIVSMDWPEELCVLNGLSVNVDELNFLAKSIERFAESEYDQFMAAVSLERSPDLERLINLSFNINHYTVVRDVSDLAGIGQYHLMNIRGSLSKTELETIDFAQVGRDLLSSGKGVPTEYGLLFENEEVPFQQVYDGTTFPPYVYKSDVVVIVNLRYKGKTEYLYLPEEDISIEKALKRLGAATLEDCALEIEEFKTLNKSWRDHLKSIMEYEGLRGVNELAQGLAAKYLDTDRLLHITEYADVVSGEDIRKLADHLDDFIVIDGAQTYADVGEYVTRHEIGYEVGEGMSDFVDYSKLGEYITQERDGQFIDGCFVCMEFGSDYAHIMGENRQEIELGGM